MTHKDRARWLSDHGWRPEIADEPCDVTTFGQSFWFDEDGGNRSLWLRVNDGSAMIHGPRREVMTWVQLTEWIEGKSPEAKKPLAGQRSLFGDE